MANVEIRVRHQTYRIACDDDQQLHVSKLSEDLSRRIDSLAKSMPSAGDTMLLLMTAMMMEDELQQLKRNQASPANDLTQDEKTHAAVTKTVDAISEYVEKLAKRVENQ